MVTVSGAVCVAMLYVCVLCVCLSDLWSGGFSSEEDEAAEEAGNQLDLLASLVAERGEGEGGGGGGGEGEEGEKESFQEALNKADDVVSMKGLTGNPAT